MAREIEILVALSSAFDEAQAALESFDFKGAKKTVDYYYYDPLRSALQLNAQNKLMECCRIREKAGKISVAYKVDHYNDDIWLYSDEFETEVESLENIQAIFSRLGLQLLVMIDNTKYTYVSKDYEIVLEDVKDLGAFLEVEFIGADTGQPVEQIKSEIYTFIGQLGLHVGDELNSGKPELLLLKQKAQTA